MIGDEKKFDATGLVGEICPSQRGEWSLSLQESLSPRTPNVGTRYNVKLIKEVRMKRPPDHRSIHITAHLWTKQQPANAEALIPHRVGPEMACRRSSHRAELGRGQNLREDP